MGTLNANACMHLSMINSLLFVIFTNYEWLEILWRLHAGAYLCVLCMKTLWIQFNVINLDYLSLAKMYDSQMKSKYNFNMCTHLR